MASLEEISLNKISIDLERLVEKYNGDIEAMKRLHAAQGKLRSGATIIATINSSKNAFISLRDICIKHLQSLVDDSVVLTETSIQNVKSKISGMFLQLYGTTFEAMTKSTAIASKPDLRDRYMPDIEKEKENTLSEVAMFIDGGVISKRNKGIKGVIKTAVGGLSKLFGSPSS